MGLAKSLDEDTLREDDTSNESPAERPDELRLIEALLCAAGEPLDDKTLRERLPEGVDVASAMRRLQAEYAPRGVNLVRVAGKWMFRTANDLAWLLARDTVEPKKLSRAANETLAIIAYHQPVTRAEIEDIRGVTVSEVTVDVLMETGWIRPRGRRKAPGRPLTFGTTQTFLEHFGLEAIGDLPGLDELKGTGLIEGRLPAGFSVPMPSDDATLREDEDPLEPGDLDLGLAPRVEPEEQTQSARPRESGDAEPDRRKNWIPAYAGMSGAIIVVNARGTLARRARPHFARTNKRFGRTGKSA